MKHNIIVCIYSGLGILVRDPEQQMDLIRIGEAKKKNGHLVKTLFREWYETIEEAQKGLLRALFTVDLSDE